MSNENQAELFDVRVAQQSRLENTRTRETDSCEASVTFLGLRLGLQGQGKFRAREMAVFKDRTHGEGVL